MIIAPSLTEYTRRLLILNASQEHLSRKGGILGTRSLNYHFQFEHGAEVNVFFAFQILVLFLRIFNSGNDTVQLTIHLLLPYKQTDALY